MYAYFALDFIFTIEIRSTDEIKVKKIKNFLIEKIFCLICAKKILISLILNQK